MGREAHKLHYPRWGSWKSRFAKSLGPGVIAPLSFALSNQITTHRKENDVHSLLEDIRLGL
jgi:hypothetical protein